MSLFTLSELAAYRLPGIEPLPKCHEYSAPVRQSLGTLCFPARVSRAGWLGMWTGGLGRLASGARIVGRRRGWRARSVSDPSHGAAVRAFSGEGQARDLA